MIQAEQEKYGIPYNSCKDRINILTVQNECITFSTFIHFILVKAFESLAKVYIPWGSMCILSCEIYFLHCDTCFFLILTRSHRSRKQYIEQGLSCYEHRKVISRMSSMGIDFF